MSDPAERAARRRWLTLAEFVGVGGLLIGAATLWLNFAERREASAQRDADQAAARAASAATRQRVGLVATDAGGARLGFRAIACALQATDIRFPKALGVAPQSTVTTHAIEAEWIAAPLLKATDGGPDRRRGRLPVLIESRCEDAGGPRVERAIYDIAWETEPGLFGRSLRVRGLVARGGPADPARLDTLWTRP